MWVQTGAAFAGVLDPATKEIDSMRFVAACLEIANVYDALFGGGILAKQLKGDILNSAETVKKAFLKNPDKCGSLRGMMEFELATMGRDKVRVDKSTGVIGMLWAKRAVQFIMVFLELLGSRPDLAAGACARETYERVLSKYHGWLTSKAVGSVMGLAPSREDIFAKLELSAATASAKIAELVTTIRVVVDNLDAVLAKGDCDFPDKV